MDVFNRVMCREIIKLEPRYITTGFKTEILARLKKKVEGICSKHGYIKHDSVEIYKIAPGVVELVSLAGFVVYDVYFYADVCNPMIGNVVLAVVSSINRFGILAESSYFVGDEYNGVLEIIIPKNSVNIQSEVDLENIKIGDEILVEIIGKKFELGEKKISAIGRVVKGEKKKPKATIEKDKNIEEEEIEEEEAYEEDEGEGEVEEEEEGDLEQDGEVEEEEEEDVDEAYEEEEEEIVKQGGSDFFSDDAGSLFSDAGEFDADDMEDGSMDEGSDAGSIY